MSNSALGNSAPPHCRRMAPFTLSRLVLVMLSILQHPRLLGVDAQYFILGEGIVLHLPEGGPVDIKRPFLGQGIEYFRCRRGIPETDADAATISAVAIMRGDDILYRPILIRILPRENFFIGQLFVMRCGVEFRFGLRAWAVLLQQ